MQHFDKDTSVPISVPLIKLFMNRDTLHSFESCGCYAGLLI